MTSPRDRILQRIKSKPSDAVKPTPYKVAFDGSDLIAFFVEKATRSGFKVHDVAKLNELKTLIDADKIAVCQRKIASIEGIAEIIERSGEADDQTYYSITRAELGVAETGSVLVNSEWDKEFSLHALVEEELILVEKGSIVATLNDAWPMVRALDEKSRVFCFITGPSKTADVEQTLQIGAHGPRVTTLILY